MKVYLFTANAEVAELAYAQVSEACGCKALRVRLPPSAPNSPKDLKLIHKIGDT